MDDSADRPPHELSARKRVRPPTADRARDRRARRNRLATRLTVVAAVWSLGLLIAASVLPVYNGETISNSDGVTFTTTTLVGSQGAWVLIPCAVPLVLCAAVWLALLRKRSGAGPRSGYVAWAGVGLLGVFALLSILSIGGFVIPVVLLLGRAVALTTPAPSRAAAAPTGPGRVQPARLG
jgi:hypothetical protein